MVGEDIFILIPWWECHAKSPVNANMSFPRKRESTLVMVKNSKNPCITDALQFYEI